MFFKSLFLLASAVLSFAGPVPQLFRTAGGQEEAGPNRRGVSYNDPKYVHLFNGPGTSKATWMYNWASWDGGNTGMGYEFVPMLHSTRPDHTGPWNSNVDKWVHAGPGTTHLLGFNEPDECHGGGGGACISLDDTVKAWSEWMDPLRKYGDKVMLGSPAVTNNGATDTGLDFLKKFLDRCKGCKVDFINIHWYDWASNLEYFKSHVNKAIEVGDGRPIWITEFRPSGNDDEVISFLEKALPWLDSKREVHRYSYTMAIPGSLINNEGNGLSRIGQAYNTI